MGKFILSKLKEKTQNFFVERKNSILSKTIAGSNFTLEQEYKLFFWCLNNVVEGVWDSKTKLVWNALITHVVDSETVCSDGGFEGLKLKKRCELIGKEKEVSVEDRFWIDKELKPYFEFSLKKQSKNISDVLFNEIVKGTITEDESKIAFNKFNNNQRAFRGFFK